MSRLTIVLSVAFLLASASTAPALEPLPHTTLLAEANNDWFSCDLVVVGDLNDDGYDDLAAGAYQNDANGNQSGAVYVYFGGPQFDAVADVTITGAAEDRLGWALAGGLDYNADGIADLAIGAYGDDTLGAFTGRVEIHFGSATFDNAADLVLPGSTAGQHFGTAVSAAGDINGDGHDDLLVGAHHSGSAIGQAFLYYGGPSPDAGADLVVLGEASGDYFGGAVAAAGDFDNDSYDDLLVGAYAAATGAGSLAGKVYLYRGGPAPDATADFVFEGEALGDGLGSTVLGGFDFNADGISDIALGAPLGSVAGAGPGRLYVHFGQSSPDLIADLVADGVQGGERFASAVVSPGDLDGDGSDDLLVGAPRFDLVGTNSGRVRVLLGGTALNPEADLEISGSASEDWFGSSLAAGHLDGDGAVDLVVGSLFDDTGAFNGGAAYLYELPDIPSLLALVEPAPAEVWAAGTSVPIRWTGTTVIDLYTSPGPHGPWELRASGLGGVAENAYRLPAPETGGITWTAVAMEDQPVSSLTSAIVTAGAVVSAPDTRPHASYRNEYSYSDGVNYSRVGNELAGIGDINNDGFDDFASGSPFSQLYGFHRGYVYIFLGGTTISPTPHLTQIGPADKSRFGSTISKAGDFNADGIDDWMVGSPRSLNVVAANRVDLYFGGVGLDDTSDLGFIDLDASESFGRDDIDGGRDLNGDGYDDIVIGCGVAGPFGTPIGKAFIYFGGPNPNAAPDITITRNSTDEFGASLAMAGDLNGDGFQDLAVAAPYASGNGANSGRVEIFFGGPGLDGNADLVIHGEIADLRLGLEVAGLGDVNGDGYDDLALAATRSEYLDDVSRIYVYFGGPSLDADPDWVIQEPNGGSGYYGSSIAGVGDVNRDGYADLLVGARDGAAPDYQGAVFLYYGGPVPDGVVDVQFDPEPTGDMLGERVAAGGDIDGDGWNDILIADPRLDDGLSQQGRLYMWSFQRYHLDSPAKFDVWATGQPHGIEWTGAEPTDIWLSLDDGVEYVPVTSGVGGAETNSFVLTAPSATTSTARIKLMPSDPGIVGGLISKVFSIEGGTPVDGLPLVNALGRPFPNPTRGRSTVTFPVSIQGSSSVELRVYDLRGRRVAQRPAQWLSEAGRYELLWDGADLAAGAYFVQLRVDGELIQTRRWLRVN